MKNKETPTLQIASRNREIAIEVTGSFEEVVYMLEAALLKDEALYVAVKTAIASEDIYQKYVNS